MIRVPAAVRVAARCSPEAVMRIRLVSVVAIALLVCSTAQAQNSAPAGSLKIVVISGEDAVNIIQQKPPSLP